MLSHNTSSISHTTRARRTRVRTASAKTLFLPLLLLTAYTTTASPTLQTPLGISSTPETGLPSDGILVSNLTECPVLPPRTIAPTSVHDLRPDDFSIVMAVGDSITAGAFAEGIVSDDVLSSFGEWRGKSYAGGGDPGALTVPNLLGHYNKTLRGASVGRNAVLEVCMGPICAPTGWNAEVDRFNAARSGALAQNSLHEVRDYLVPQLKKHDVSDDEFKYMSFQVGSNDVCQLCLSDMWGWGFGPGSPSAFEADIMSALEHVRKHIPNTVVNLVGVFPVSQVWDLTHGQTAYCQKTVPNVPHYTIGCSCALYEGVLGEWYRRQMDQLGEKYNQRLMKIVRMYQKLNDPSFAVLWQPAAIPLASYPIEAVSDVDCFHPSTANHERIAAGVWNRLTLNATQRAIEFDWNEDVLLRCLEEDDRLQTRNTLEDPEEAHTPQGGPGVVVLP